MVITAQVFFIKIFVFLTFFTYICIMEELNNKPYGYWNIKENCFEEAKKKDKYWNNIDNVLNAAKECT